RSFAGEAHGQRTAGWPCPVEPGAPHRLERDPLRPAGEPGLGDGGKRLEGFGRGGRTAMRGKARCRLLTLGRVACEVDAGADLPLAAVLSILACAFDQHACD